MEKPNEEVVVVEPIDSMEAGNVSMSTKYKSQHLEKQVTWARTLSLAFQSLGIVYGDIATSPLYVFSSTFAEEINDKDDILGVLSLIIYTLLLIPFLKYVFIVLRANDNGDGGTIALYSLIRRYAKIGLIPNDQPEDQQLSVNVERADQKIKGKLESSIVAQVMLFLVTILGTSMVIGDGVLTPCISVLSAVSGIKSLSQDAVVGVSVAILVVLFCVQRFGTNKVGNAFAPLVLIWLLLIGGIGVYNLFKYDIGVLRALYPKYIINYFKRNGRKGWISLGGVVLCITGAEAMFADLGHFNVRAIQISFSCIVLPALLAAYSGQAAYLTKFPGDVKDTFYASIPDPLYWPIFVSAVAAAIIGSQAMISGTFSIVSQSLDLNCFPRVKVVHTSAKHQGQVYIPEVNYILMVACVIVCLAFRTTTNIGNAYGIAVVAVMLITTSMVSLIMLVVWRTNIWLITLFFVVFGSLEIGYLSSVLYKFKQGGYLPLALSLVLMVMMAVWHYVQRLRYKFELNNKVSSEFLRYLASNPNINRIPGIGLVYSELDEGIPLIFPHFIKNIPSLHSLVVFVSIKHMPIAKVAVEEKFLFQRVDAKEYNVYRCVVKYGYKDKTEEESEEFVRQIVDNLKEFVHHEQFIEGVATECLDELENARNSTQAAVEQNQTRISSDSIRSSNSSTMDVHALSHGVEDEMQFVETAMEHGVVYLIGEVEVVAQPNSSFLKKMVVNYAYSFLRKNCREGGKSLGIPRSRQLRVGMTYEI